MKSKAFILMQIEELLTKNRGLCDQEIREWREDNKEKTVYELPVIKKELSQTQEYHDVSFMRWFRE